MLILQGVSYIHQNGDLLFDHINLKINKQDKIALIGNNGAGKSTLFNILTGSLAPSSGLFQTETKPYAVPQHFGQYNELTIAEALQIDDKINALYEILDGHVTDSNLALLDDDWAIEERCAAALRHWGIDGLDLSVKMKNLSGGQKTKVFLAGISVHQPEVVLLDEPSNHLDSAGREILYDYIATTLNTLVVISHDRTLLNLPDMVCELNKSGIKVYGGNYEYYVQQKEIEHEALNQDLKGQEKALRKAKTVEKASLERQHKLDARGKKKQEKAGISRISMNTLRNNAEKSTSRMKDVHAGKVNELSEGLTQLRKELPAADKMKIGFDNSGFHRGKVLVTAEDINFGYNTQKLWGKPLNFRIAVGERIALKGANGSGKTTLIKLILGQVVPQTGILTRAAAINTIYIDQDYSLIDNRISIYEQAQHANSGALQEHEIKIRLNRFLFTKEFWDKPCSALSGGEKMRLMLCCLTINVLTPDIIILDEPTNNLDIQNIEMLTIALQEYQGTLLVVSHDEYFLKQINIERVL